ncbi:MAG: transposase [Acidobacteriaceae bacterium]|nr:transposase [Acidobacteriota bacterium]MBV8807713.1 transposase [Acidobacteriaceae bacterium]
MSEESRRKWDRYSVEFRQQALERMKTCDNVKALAKELGVARQQLYWWKQRAERRANPREPGATEDPRDRRIRELTKKVGELEGVIGQKTLELDFFAGALRRVEESRQKKGISGETASTLKSESGCNRKAD